MLLLLSQASPGAREIVVTRQSGAEKARRSVLAIDNAQGWRVGPGPHRLLPQALMRRFLHVSVGR